MQHSKVYNLVLCALFAAVQCICSLIVLPIGPVPITMGFFGVMLSAAVLGWKRGFLSTLVFVLLGAVGLPVFSYFRGGFAVLAGPTGGYIWSYLLMALVVGALGAHKRRRKNGEIAVGFAACLLAVAIGYFCGTLQYTLVAGVGWREALAVCVFPFIPLDVAKCFAASLLAYTLRRAIYRSHR